MKKIAFIAHGPGTANALFPLIEPLKEQYEVHLFAFHPYASKLWQTELSLLEEFPAIFTQSFDLIVTGTGSLHEVEKKTPILAREANIPVVSILDIWGNYRARYEQEPDYIICLDELSKIDLMYEGISPSKIIPLGNPHFDRLAQYIGFYPVAAPFNVVFFSQPIKQSQEALYYLLCLKDAYPDLFKHLYITPHPREDETWLRKIANEEANTTFKMYDHSFQLMLDTDLSVGFGSTLQHEAAIIGKRTIFYQHPEQMKKEFFTLFDQQRTAKIIDFHATERCVAFIRNLLDT